MPCKAGSIKCIVGTAVRACQRLARGSQLAHHRRCLEVGFPHPRCSTIELLARPRRILFRTQGARKVSLLGSVTGGCLQSAQLESWMSMHSCFPALLTAPQADIR